MEKTSWAFSRKTGCKTSKLSDRGTDRQKNSLHDKQIIRQKYRLQGNQIIGQGRTDRKIDFMTSKLSDRDRQTEK